jgi:hypothetical protein
VNVINSYLINNLAVENPDDRLTVAEIKTQNTTHKTKKKNHHHHHPNTKHPTPQATRTLPRSKKANSSALLQQ